MFEDSAGKRRPENWIPSVERGSIKREGSGGIMQVYLERAKGKNSYSVIPGIDPVIPAKSWVYRRTRGGISPQSFPRRRESRFNPTIPSVTGMDSTSRPHFIRPWLEWRECSDKRKPLDSEGSQRYNNYCFTEEILSIVNFSRLTLLFTLYVLFLPFSVISTRNS